MRFTIDRLEDDEAVLRTDDGQELIVAVGELPEGAEEGGVIVAGLRGDSPATDARANQAKDILNEILGSNDQ